LVWNRYFPVIDSQENPALPDEFPQKPGKAASAEYNLVLLLISIYKLLYSDRDIVHCPKLMPFVNNKYCRVSIRIL
jgi:hypothetical protein